MLFSAGDPNFEVTPLPTTVFGFRSTVFLVLLVSLISSSDVVR